MKSAKSGKFLLISSVLVILTLTLAGCGTSNIDKQTGAQSDKQEGQNISGNKGSSMPDFGQPKTPADIRGVVKLIVGNEATVLKMDFPAGGRRASSSPDSVSGSGPAVSLTGTANIPVGGARGAGNFRGQGGPGEGGTTDRAVMLAELKKMSTGEEKVIIPVGIQMLKSSVDTTTKKRSMVEATLEDITADKMITVWLNTSVTDKKVAEFILIN